MGKDGRAGDSRAPRRQFMRGSWMNYGWELVIEAA